VGDKMRAGCESKLLTNQRRYVNQFIDGTLFFHMYAAVLRKNEAITTLMGHGSSRWRPIRV